MALTEWHTQFPGGVRWRLTSLGVDIEGSGVERTSGQPLTTKRVWETYSNAINQFALQYQIPCALIIANICTESSGKADSVRQEPGYVSDEATPNKISVGLMQTLISTARETLNKNSIDRAWLLQPANSIEAGAAYIAKKRNLTKLDPPLAAAAYNAGGIYQQDGPNNRWKLRQYPIGTSEHCDRYVKFFNDAVAMLAVHPTPAAVGIDILLESDAMTIHFGHNARQDTVLSQPLSVLEDLLEKAGLSSMLITSTARTPADQARVMYQNLEAKGVADQKRLYGVNGDKVIDVYDKAKRNGESPNQIKSRMEQEIIAIGPGKVSRHCADYHQLCVVDIDPDSIANHDAFKAAVKSDSRISQSFFPPADPAYHLEIAVV